MVNEEKTRIMIKIAKYESELGTKVINEGGYYKTDYVRLHTLSVVLNVSVAYIFVLALVALYNMDYIFLNFVTINYAKLFIEIFMPYISIIIICVLVSNIYFTSKYKNSLMYETERDTYMLIRLKKLLNRTVWAVTEQMKLGKFDTIESEFTFDITEDSDNIKDNKKDIIHLIGRIDRIDEHKDDKCTYLKIVDYKTGKKDMSLSDLYYGLQMQLVIYLKAAMEAADETKLVIPAGVLYYNIADPVIEGKPDKSQVEVEMLKSLKMRGIVNEDDPVIPLLDANFETDTGELPVKVSSVIAPFGTDKDGNLKKASQVITTKDFDNIISYTQKNIVNMGKEIMDGRTEAYPYRKNDTEGRTACDYCGYRDICRFDVRIPGNSFRVLSKLSDDDVLNKIQEPEDNNK